MRRYIAVLMLLVAFFTLTACGSDSNDSTYVPSSTVTKVSGSVFAGPVSGGRVTVKDGLGNTVAGPVNTTVDGTFEITLPAGSLSKNLDLESTGGTYTDEATGQVTTAGRLGARLAPGTNSVGVSLDPSSTIMHRLVTVYGLSFTNAASVYNSAFGYTPGVMPKNAPATGADTAPMVSALRAMAFSHLTRVLGMGPEKQFDMLTAIGDDLSDGVMDGMKGGSPISIINGPVIPEDMLSRFEQSLISMISNTTTNNTGLKPDQVGHPPFAKLGLTNSYKIAYIPGMMPAIAGKSSFKLRITSRIDNTPVSGLGVKLLPLMHMSTMNHATPVDAVVEDTANPGMYNCTAYYLMASVMAGGASVGFWEMKVAIGSGASAESVTFYPFVGMSMGTETMRATLKGVSDTIAAMPSAEKRSYYLFNEGASPTSLKLFIAAKESMMSYPGVYNGVSLKDASGASWTASPVVVSASTDATNWVTATENSGGHWTVSGLTGLTAGTAGKIYVKLSVNGELKTTEDGVTAYATFNVTPK